MADSGSELLTEDTSRLTQDAKEAIDYANGVIGSENNEENKFQKAIAAWRNINLSQLVPTLDSTASDIAGHQRDALVERKELAQKTKDFRKLDDPGKLAEIKALLKAYQTYIDLVTNQSKSISTSFFQVYSPLSEAPDPYPLLEASVESLVVADETLPKLEAENKQLQATASKLTKQLENVEKELQEESATRRTLEQNQESKVKEVEASWSAVLAEKQDNWESRERSLEDKVDNQDRLLKELKASYEVSQRLDRGDDGDNAQRGFASAAELEMVTSDLERANSRLADVESRNEQLRLELAQNATSNLKNQGSQSLEDDPSFLRLRSENSSLLRKAEAVRLERDGERRGFDTAIRGMRKDIAALKSDSVSLRSKVKQWSDYEEVKKELEILKSIEFATGDNDEFAASEEQAGDGSATMGSDLASRQADAQNLEQLLMARNKKLNNELTILRVSHQDLASRLDTLQEDLSSTNMELERSRNLNAILEDDLARVQNEAADEPAMSVAGTYTSRYPTSSLRRGRRASPTSSIISGIDASSQSPGGTLESLRAGEPIGGGSGILPMITAQRDRFKKRITELENELSKAYQNITTLRSEVSSLQKDNLNLYEKTRYVSTYNRGGQPASSASSYGNNPNPSSVSLTDGSASPIDRYKSAYESKISPFAAFRGRESARAFKRMSLPERMLFQITRMVLATRRSRNFFAFYLLVLHLLMFFMLYWSATVDVEQHMTHLADNAAPVLGSALTGAAKDTDWHQQEGFQEAGPPLDTQYLHFTNDVAHGTRRAFSPSGDALLTQILTFSATPSAMPSAPVASSTGAPAFADDCYYNDDGGEYAATNTGSGTVTPVNGAGRRAGGMQLWTVMLVCYSLAFGLLAL